MKKMKSVSQVAAFILIGLVLVSFSDVQGQHPFPEGNQPRSGDTEQRLLYKVVALLNGSTDVSNTSAATAPVTGTEVVSSTVAADGTAAAANAVRVELILSNVGTTTAFIKRGAGASTTDYDFILVGKGTAPVGGVATLTNWRGVVSVAFTTATGSLRVSELD